MSEVKENIVESVKEVTEDLGMKDAVIGYVILGATLAVGYKLGKRKGRIAANRKMFDYIKAVGTGIEIAQKDEA